MTEESRLPVLYTFRRCPYAMRARLAIAISGFACEVREVKLSNKPASMLAASPKGTVPVLVLSDGSVLEESLDIMRFVLEQKDPEGWLVDVDPTLIARCDGPFKRDLDRYKYPERYGSDAMAHRSAGEEFLRVLDDKLRENGQLCGQNRNMTDMAIMPFVRQFAATDRNFFDSLPLVHLRKWLDEHLDSPLFASIMTKYNPWQPGDAQIRFGKDEPSA